MQDRFKFRYFDENHGMKEISLTNCYYTNLDYSKLMQCTGSRDKHGKLIYEGDIVKTTLANNSKITFLVVWNDKEALFDGKILKRDGVGGYFIARQDYLYYLLGNGKDEKTEVIGNKFQNPELLSEVK